MCGKFRKRILQRKKNLLKYKKETGLLCQRARNGEFKTAEDLLKEYFTKCWTIVRQPLKEETIKRKIRIVTRPPLSGIYYSTLMIEDVVNSNIIRGRLREINWLLKNL